MQKYIFLVALVIAGLFFASCNNHSKCPLTINDSLNITDSIIKKFMNHDTLPEAFSQKFSRLFRLSYRPSTIITETQGRNYHQDYLHSAFIYDLTNHAVHFLSISQGGLDTIYTNAKKGARLYFCLEPDHSFNIIMVAVGNNDENLLQDAQGNTIIVNKLDPCPDNCIGGPDRMSHDLTDLNCDNSNPAQPLWYKPNINDPSKPGKHWVDKNNNVIN